MDGYVIIMYSQVTYGYFSFYFFVTEIEICLFQPFPMYQVSTMWQQVVPKLNAKGRDLLQVSFKFAY